MKKTLVESEFCSQKLGLDEFLEGLLNFQSLKFLSVKNKRDEYVYKVKTKLKK